MEVNLLRQLGQLCSPIAPVSDAVVLAEAVGPAAPDAPAEKTISDRVLALAGGQDKRRRLTDPHENAMHAARARRVRCAQRREDNLKHKLVMQEQKSRIVASISIGSSAVVKSF